MTDNQAYQYSIVSALMDGVASKGVPISRVLAHGDMGLGTFAKMDGEMIVIDGKVYQMKADSSVHLVNPETTITPFATVTRFRPSTSSRAEIADKKGFSSLLSKLLPGSKNHFTAIRMDGTFTIKVRTAGGQCYEREPMTAVAERQTTHDFKNIRGTMVGFRCPEYVMGVNVAGDHLHFISDDRERGGHVLEFETIGEVEVKLAKLSTFTVDLPTDDSEFDEANLVKDADGINKVEG